ncbi:MAG TPA: type II toxin-antitoxin system VapC family toxin [Aggregatilineales bacterium]|nr:type II toxin-antitoxin system VapC family toxin [Aggregatilineales bacterium]
MHAKQILSLWQSTHTQLIAPILFKSEITAVLRKVVYQNRITHHQGELALQRLLNYPIQFYDDDSLLKRAFELAQIYNRPRAYDTQYLLFCTASSSASRCDAINPHWVI